MCDVMVRIREETGEEPECSGIGPLCSCWVLLLDVQFGFCRGCAHHCARGVLNAAKLEVVAALADDADTAAVARRDARARLRNALPIALERHLGADRTTVARVRAALDPQLLPV
jgi:hypothetical protein